MTATPQTLAASGGSIVVSVQLNFPETTTALGLQFTGVPAGWTFGGATGANVPQAAPRNGDTSIFEFAYFNIPSSPAHFSFTVNYPAGVAASQSLSGITAIFRGGAGGAQQVAVPALAFAPASAGGGGGGPVLQLPAILSSPVSLVVSAGASAVFGVNATGSPPLLYQWRKDGVAIAGASQATLTLSNVAAAAAGAYSVAVSNAAGSVISAAATLTVTTTPSAEPPRITAQPVSRTVAAGGTAAFSVTATGAAPLAYQWRRNGLALPGMTSATLNLANVTPDMAGNYTVLISNAAGSVVSAEAALTITTAASLTGTYFGQFGGGKGSFALQVRPDRSAAFLGYLRESATAIVVRQVVVQADGRFRAVSTATATTAAGSGVRAAAAAELVVEGALDLRGGVSGVLGGADLAFAGSASPGAVPAPATGYYEAGAAGSSATAYAIVGPAGNVLVLTIRGTEADAGEGVLDQSGQASVVSARGASLNASSQPAFGVMILTSARPGEQGVTFVGSNRDRGVPAEKLVNVSARSRVGSGSSGLIAGFVVAGARPVAVLVRGVGPTLARFGVEGPVPAARLQILRGSTTVGEGTDWGAAANAGEVSRLANEVGAFRLPEGSADAALVLTLEPGAYTALLDGREGAGGVGLIEIYDASGAPGGEARLINLSTRAHAGPGEEALIAGFAVRGVLPKRMLVRGVGPSLAEFGVSGALPRVDLAVLSGESILVENRGWGTAPEAAEIRAAATAVGAFPLAAGSLDSAVLIHLSPGSYTARVTGGGGTAGTALLEIYEIP